MKNKSTNPHIKCRTYLARKPIQMYVRNGPQERKVHVYNHIVFAYNSDNQNKHQHREAYRSTTTHGDLQVCWQTADMTPIVSLIWGNNISQSTWQSHAAGCTRVVVYLHCAVLSNHLNSWFNIMTGILVRFRLYLEKMAENGSGVVWV